MGRGLGGSLKLVLWSTRNRSNERVPACTKGQSHVVGLHVDGVLQPGVPGRRAKAFKA